MIMYRKFLIKLFMDDFLYNCMYVYLCNKNCIRNIYERFNFV